MPIVAVYGFTGTFDREPSHAYEHPVPGATHQCMLFLSQADEAPVEDLARAECERYGFGSVTFTGFGPLRVEVLESEQFRGFAGLWQEATREGSALVFYPN